MGKQHAAAITAGIVIIAILWVVVVPLLLDLGERSGRNAAVGWLVLLGATVLVGWLMFRPPRAEARHDSGQPSSRRGLRRAARQRRRRNGS